MSRVRLAVSAALMALALSACGIAAKPIAGSSAFKHETAAFHGRVQNLRMYPARCLKKAHVRFHEYSTAKQHLPVIQVGSKPTGPTIVFYPTPGIAQGLQIMSREQGAEVIGTSLLYPNQAGAKKLKLVEACARIRVSG